MLRNFEDFVQKLLAAGFSLGGGNDEGIYAVVDYTWNKEPEGALVRWHTGDQQTDPWEWRMRVLEEREDIAYGKVFFRKSGFITKAWYPCFLAVRRQGLSFQQAYQAGQLSHMAKQIYEIIQKEGPLPVHGLKLLGGFSKEDASRFDRGLTELQMKLLLTTCGRRQKQSKTGEAYGWSSTVFCRTEDFWDEDVFAQAARLSPEEAMAKVHAQVKRLNPEANEGKIVKFVKG